MEFEGGKYQALGLALVVFFLYAAFPFLSPKIYNSPDDQANAIFIKQFAEHGRLWYEEKLNPEFGGRIVSRSMLAIGERVVPIGFPGFPIFYGALAWLITPRLMDFFTPFFVALSVAILYLAINKRWGAWLAFVAATAYAFNPALWYYASRGLYPNALVIALVVIALCVIPGLTRDPVHSEFHKRKVLDSGSVAGMTMLALAIFIRPIEAIWILPLALAFPRRWQYVGAIVLGGIAALIANRWVYGSWHATGYSASLAAANAFETVAPTIRSTFGRIVRFALPLFPVQNILAICAFVWLARKKENLAPLLLLSLLSLLILAPYAIFGARDVVGDRIPTIGTSLVRYWMPVFLIGAAITVIAAKEIRSRLIVSMALTVYLATSFYAVWFGTPDSLWLVLKSLRRYEAIKQEVLPIVESNAIVIAEQADKVFFPDRRVAAWLRNPGMIESIPKMLGFAPVYYYGITLPAADLDIIAKKAPEVKLEALRTYGIETLYRFSP